MTKYKLLIIRYWAIILLGALALSISWPLFMKGYFFHHDDLQVMRVFEMRKCFEDLQIPCRWVPDMGYGNGYPLFNYYGPLPYYIGATFSYFFSFVNSAKVLFFIPLFLGGFTMYLLAKELFGKIAGFGAAVLYLMAPYRALDIFVRGAINESFAMTIIPLVFYFSLRLIKEKKLFNFLGLSISLGFFLIAHTIMTMLFIPVLLLWLILWLYLEGKKNWRILLISVILGFGLAAFYIGPAIVEKPLITAETLIRGGTDYKAHFVAVNQLFFSRYWGYGGSEFGPNDTISFQIGWPHWWIILATLLIMLLRVRSQEYWLFLFLIGVFGVSVFMMHNLSTPIYLAVEPLQYIQFPWRFLSLTVFAVSLTGGFFISIFFQKWQKYLMAAVVILVVTLNWQFFLPRDFYPWIDDKLKLSDPLWEIQQKAGILDYLPITAYEPMGRAPFGPEIISGKAEVKDFKNRSNYWQFNINIKQKANVEVPVFDFPNWETFVNGKLYQHSHANKLGRIRLDLAPGSYQVRGEFKNTTVRTITNLMSLMSIITICVLIFKKKHFKLIERI